MNAKPTAWITVIAALALVGLVLASARADTPAEAVWPSICESEVWPAYSSACLTDIVGNSIDRQVRVVSAY